MKEKLDGVIKVKKYHWLKLLLKLIVYEVDNVCHCFSERLLAGLKEHKASTTLGIIMSAFIFCWFPFFVLALVRPLFRKIFSHKLSLHDDKTTYSP